MTVRRGREYKRGCSQVRGRCEIYQKRMGEYYSGALKLSLSCILGSQADIEQGACCVQ